MSKLEAAQLTLVGKFLTNDEIIEDFCPCMLGVGEEKYNKNCDVTKCKACWNKTFDK